MSGITDDQAVLIKTAIKDHRKEKGMTQTDLAEATGIPLSTLKKYEQGTRNPKLNSLMKIGEVLDFDFVSLLSNGSVDKKTDESGKREYKATYLTNNGTSLRVVLYTYDFSGSLMNERDKFMVAVSNAYDCKDKGTLVCFEVVNKNN